MAVSVPFGPLSCRCSLQVPSCLLPRWICADSFVTLPSFHFLLPAPRPTSSSRKRELRGCHLLVGKPFFGLYIEDFVCMIRICVSKKDVCKYLSACSRLAWRRTGLNRNGGPCYADKQGIFLAASIVCGNVAQKNFAACMRMQQDCQKVFTSLAIQTKKKPTPRQKPLN